MKTKPDSSQDFDARHARNQRNAKAAIKEIHRNLPKSEDPDLAHVLGMILEDFKYPDEACGSPFPVWVEGAIEQYMGKRCQALIPEMLRLHARLMRETGKAVALPAERLARLAEESYERTALPVLDHRELVPEDPWMVKFLKDRDPEHEPEPHELLRKALVLTEQSRHYVVILEKEFDRWNIHVREWFVTDHEDSETDRLLARLREAKDRKSSLDILAQLVERRGHARTDMEGVGYPNRLGIRAFIDSKFAIHDEHKSCPGIRYEDFRDVGYVLSCKQERPEDGWDLVRCKDAWVRLRDISCFFCYAFSHHDAMDLPEEEEARTA